MDTKVWQDKGIDKSQWDEGPWKSEPDKVQWIDDKTGLYCMIIRGPVGALCGYVGVPEGHPFYGVKYNGCVRGKDCPEFKSWDEMLVETAADLYKANLEGDQSGARFCEMMLKIYRSKAEDPKEYGEGPGCNCHQSLERHIEVHGGLTYSGQNDDDPMSFEEWITASCEPEWKDHTQRYGLSGDSTYDDYLRWFEAGTITWVPAQDIWWIGFDCSHSMDCSPGYTAPRFKKILGEKSILAEGMYRTVEYVRQEVEKLAMQIHNLATQPEVGMQALTETEI